MEFGLLLALWSSSFKSSLVSNMASLLVLSLPFLYKASLGDLKSAKDLQSLWSPAMWWGWC